jgi:hypothetical protein
MTVSARFRALGCVLAACACVVLARGAATAEWQPGGLRPATTVSLGDVLAANAKAAGTAPAARRERWTYVNGDHRLAVRVAVKGENYRVTIPLGGIEYEAGRFAGVPWRGDGNGIVHSTTSEDQGDALDRIPRSLFPFRRDHLALAGETDRPPAWVIADRSPRDKPRWIYVDRTSGDIVRETVREGARTVVTSFEDFTTAGGVRRAKHWHVRDDNPRDDLDVTLEGADAQPVDDAAVAIPETQRVFAPLDPPARGVVTLPAHFDHDRISIDVVLDGHRSAMVLDTGTASITLDVATARKYGWQPVLEHATVPKMTVGGVGLSNVSTLAIPFTWDRTTGILGYDFFFGHVVHVDYANQRVELLTPEAAVPVFRDPRMTVVPMHVGEGLPLVQAAFGAAAGDRFALDTGSPELFVLDPFARRWAKEISARWTPATFRNGRAAKNVEYLEGSIRVAAYRASTFQVGPARFADVVVGVEQPNGLTDGIAIPLDGIIGTNQLRFLDLWFDYDENRLAMRRNAT